MPASDFRVRYETAKREYERRKPKAKTRKVAPQPSMRDYATSGLSALQAMASPQQTGTEIGLALADALPGMYESAKDYVMTSSPSDVAGDVMGGLRSVGSYLSDPYNAASTAVDFIPGIGEAKQFGEDINRAAELRAAGNPLAARNIERLALPLALASIVPGIGEARTGARAAGEAFDVARAAERAAPTFERPSVSPIVTQAGERGLPVRGRAQVEAQHPSKFGIFSSYKTPTPVEATEVVTEPFAVLPRDRLFDTSRLQGARVVSLYGDKERAGDIIKSVGGLPTNLRTHGGAMFPALQEALGGNAAWASEKGALTAVRRAITEGLEAGQPVFGVTTTMGPGAVNQTIDMTDLLHQMAASSPIRKRDLAVFDKRARSVLPGYAGLLHEEAPMQLHGMTQGQRKAFVGLLDNAAALEQGFPSVGAARYGLTDPNLVDVPAGASGYSFVELGPESLTPLEGGIEHPTYADRMHGTYEGRGPLVPFDLMFSDFVRARREAGAPAGSDLRALELAKPSQVVTPEDYDRLMKYIELTGGQL